MKLLRASSRSVTLQPTSIPLRIFQICTLRRDRLATHFRLVRSSMARKKGSDRFLLNSIERKRKDRIRLKIFT